MLQTNSSLSKNAQTVQDVLNTKALPFTVIELSGSTRTATDAARTIGCEVAQIIKSLIFCTQKTRKSLLILVSGANRVNEKNIETLIGEKIMKADAHFTKEVTGFAIGGIPPIGHLHLIETLIDGTLFQFDTLWAAAGSPSAVFQLPSSALVELTQGQILPPHSCQPL